MHKHSEQQIIGQCDVVCLGSFQSQKTALLSKISQRNMNSTIIFNGSSIEKKLEYNHNNIQLTFQDIPFTNRAKNVQQCRKGEGFLFVYNVSIQNSFHLLQDLLNLLKECGKIKSPKLLIAFQPKNQLKNVSSERGMSFAIQNNMMFEQIYEKQNINLVDKLMARFFQQITLKSHKTIRESKMTVSNSLVQVENSDFVQKEVDRLNNIIKAFNEVSINYTHSIIAKEQNSNFKARIRMQSNLLAKLQSENEVHRERIKLLEKSIASMQLEKTVKHSRLNQILEPFSQIQLSQIVDSIDEYQSVTLKLREEFVTSIGQLRQKVISLESICDQMEGINDSNFIQKISLFLEEYCKYKLDFCPEIDISLASQRQSFLNSISLWESMKLPSDL